MQLIYRVEQVAKKNSLYLSTIT